MYTRPPLKYPGGKFQLLKRINRQLGQGKLLVDCFVGGGSVFLNAPQFEAYQLSDINADLINFYQSTKNEPKDLLQYASSLFTHKNNTAKRYYQLREQYNFDASLTTVEKAGLLLYFSRFGYNGLMRFNGSGHFNVPFGKYKEPYFPEKELAHLIAISPRCTFSTASYTEVLGNTYSSGTAFYFDPPYSSEDNKSATFTQYAGNKFDVQEHVQLKELAAKQAADGHRVVISNHSTRFTRKLYREARCSYFSVRRSVSCNGTDRHRAKELLAVY